MRPLNSPPRVTTSPPSEPTRSFRWALRFPEIAAALLVVATFAAAASSVDQAARLKSQQLVTAAAQADIAGDKAHNLGLLHEAIQSDPDNRLAHWQLGEVEVDGKWVSVEESQRRAAADPRQAEYSQLRTAAGKNPQAHFELARWCRKNNLTDEAVFHWANVLCADPNNEEALRALGMRWVDGQLMTHEQGAQLKRQTQEARNAAKRWEPIITKWRRAVSGNDIHAHDAALDEIRAIDKLDAIPSIEEVTLGRSAFDMSHAEECLQIAVAFIDALEKMPDQVATESLVRHAVIPPGNKARAFAAEKLKSRPKTDYVPILLNGLSMPIESSFNVSTDETGNVHYSHSLYQEGPDADRAVDASYSTIQSVFPGRNLVYRKRYNIIEDHTPNYAPRIAAVSQIKQKNYRRAAAVVELQVAQANQTAEEFSARVLPVLASTTGKEFNTAKQWWDWWRESNEYYSSEHPVDYRIYSGTDRRYYGNMNDSLTVNPSCFTKGTPIWTKTGNRAIETLELGDLVLSQDVDTGEFSYKPLIGRTVRPPSPTIKISLEDDQVQATKGHPFWVSGVGWQMAKELGNGAVLHGISGSEKIRSVEPMGDAEAYNLVVADFSTYFVGESGFLVHDNTPRRPTRAIVPGLTVK